MEKSADDFTQDCFVRDMGVPCKDKPAVDHIPCLVKGQGVCIDAQGAIIPAKVELGFLSGSDIFPQLF